MLKINKVKAARMFRALLPRARMILTDPVQFKNTIADARDALSGRGDGPLTAIGSKLRTLISMATDFRKGTYRKLPKSTIIGVIAFFLYLSTPLDVIPDFIPFLGMLDDVFVFNFLWKQIDKDIEKYLAWKESNQEGKIYGGSEETNWGADQYQR